MSRLVVLDATETEDTDGCYRYVDEDGSERRKRVARVVFEEDSGEPCQ